MTEIAVMISIYSHGRESQEAVIRPDFNWGAVGKTMAAKESAMIT
jgi:hypothetical protein